MTTDGKLGQKINLKRPVTAEKVRRYILLILAGSIGMSVLLWDSSDAWAKAAAVPFMLSFAAFFIFAVWDICVCLTWKIEERLFFKGAGYYVENKKSRMVRQRPPDHKPQNLRNAGGKGA